MSDLLKKYNFPAILEKLSESAEESDRLAGKLGKDILIADPEFAKHLKSVVETKTNFSISHPLTDQGLTLMHLAVIAGNSPAVKAVADAGSPLEPKDHRQWTPLHHAALMGASGMIDFLLLSGVDSEAKTDRAGTYQDILHLVHRKPLPENTKISLTFLDAEGTESPLTVGDYFKLTGTHYIDDTLIDPEQYFDDWIQPPMELPIFDFSRHFKIHRKSLLQHLPRCFAAPLSQDSSGRPLPEQRSVALFAGEKIGVGQMIVEFCCHLSHPAENETIRYQNESTLIPEGFPNCSMVSYTDSDGVPLRGAIIAIEPIKTGELLCRNYMERRFKVAPYPLLRCGEMEAFIRDQDVPQMIDWFIVHLGNPNIDMIAYDKLSKIRYIVETPAALWWLILHETITLDTACYIVAAGSLTRLIPVEEHALHENFLKVAKSCLIIKELIQNADSSAPALYIAILTEFVEKYPFVDAMFRAVDLCNMWKKMLEKKGNGCDRL